ncbi:MAG: LytTR family DNA-binding domain-containing protein [bacterium]|nr:LytTR family DNA-binding domain-containing protein [bacterium]
MKFIIYEDEKEYATRYQNVIHKILGPTNLNYEIIEIDEYNEETKKKLKEKDGNKVYILDIEVPGINGLELARKIRKIGDWTSPIIIVTSHEEFRNVGYTGKILMLNFILKNKELEKDLYESLEVALEINMANKSLRYTNKGESYHIPHQDILYIEKSLNDNTSCIVTKNHTYDIRKTIKELEKELSDTINFVKTHRSCIVNVKNIKHIDFENNTITFTNKKIALLSRANKKLLKERMKGI